jgi:hypothetical protein
METGQPVSSEGHGVDSDSPGCWVGLHQNLNFGDLELYGCDEGCGACPDYPDELQSHNWSHESGSRFMRPMPGVRDARGLVHDLISGEAHPFNLNPGLYEKGACYGQANTRIIFPQQFGTECFGASPCQCFDFTSPIPSGEPASCGGMGVGEVMHKGETFFPDAFTFVGTTWHNEFLNCRNFREFGTIPVPVGPNLSPAGLMTNTVRSSSIKGPGNCSTNAYVMCLAEVKSTSSCLGEYAADPVFGGNPPTHYMSNTACRTMLEHLQVQSNTMRLASGGAFPFVKTPELDLKNKILDYMKVKEFVVFGNPNRIRFAELDINLSQAASARAHYFKELNGFRDCSLSISPQPAGWVENFTNWTLSDGTPIPQVDCRVHFARMDVASIAEKFVGQDGMELEYHIRVKFEIEVKYVVVDAGTSGVVNNEDCMLLPVAPTGKRIIYRDQLGRRLRPPRRVIWRGYLGRLGQGGTPRQPALFGATQQSCRSIAENIGNLEVPGWPVLKDSWPDEPAQLYQGGIRFSQFVPLGC